ncbi:hypothetical protein [Hymenobacter negativus]|uniref:Outer membrane protein beta-barrel domain-containing protein n=1 Tax=Hymenobacter negativus TaxID=2795026 RepID=A0ABS0Q3G1_9BACT|nr:hypothetical protein [Hymenobacter negativus]MBH8556908.1 hypothetical protein [Hymenobacter negativus]
MQPSKPNRQWVPAGAMRRGLVLLGLLAGALPAARAQQVLVHANVADDTVKTTFGPNRRYFGHAYVGYGLLAGPAGTGAAVRYGLSSAELRVGGRLKFRVSQVLAFNADLGYAYQRFSLAQDGQKRVPGPSLHRSEILALHQLFSEVSLRLNCGRRGNAVGSYLDLLAGGSWAAATAHTTDDAPAPGIGSVETTERGLPYLRRWSSTAGARVGIDRYALTAHYRLSPVFAAGYAAWPELPRWTLGFEIGLF